MNVDKAGRAYWEDVWAANSPKPQPAAVVYLNKRFRRFFSTIFRDSQDPGVRLLEVGCGASLALSDMASEFGFCVTGIDYTEAACEKARAHLARQGTAGEIICADFFDPPENLRESFDVVLSSGLVEHFTETADCI